MENKVRCEVCEAEGGSYFQGHEDPFAPHPWYASTGSEGRCDLCGGPANALVHTKHAEMEAMHDRRSK